ncbi:MAG: hypothetical protein U0Z26_00770 [Anaerolineales bacterium]
MNKLRYLVLSTAVLMTLLFSAIHTAPALADDGTPPPATDATPVPASEDAGGVVPNAGGESLPLAVQDAGQPVEGDPIWCPAGVVPKDNLGGCSPSFTSFNNDGSPDLGLINWLNDGANATKVSKAGVIWVAYNYSATAVAPGEAGAMNIVGSSVAGTMENFALTVQGGLNALGSTALNTATPYSTLSNAFSITGWNNAVTINNIMVNGATEVGYYALNIQTTGNITLANVDVVNNTTSKGGANLDNTSGLGNVVLNDSTFDGNTSDFGISVLSHGTITAKNLSANGNGGNGAQLNNASAVTPKTVTLTGSNNFKFNTKGGLVVLSTGAITLSNVTATSNAGGSGAYLDNCAGYDVNQYCLNSVPSAVTLNGTSNFSNNDWDGLRVWSGGVITVNNLTANGNGIDPLRPAADVLVSGLPDYLNADNYDAYGKGVFLNNFGTWTSKAITINGTNTFNGNASNGLFTLGLSTIKVNNLTANNNNCYPLFDLDISYCAGAYLDGLGVTLTDYGTFLGNNTAGLKVASFKTVVTLNNLNADFNAGDGVSVAVYGPTPAALSILGTNTFSENTGDGLRIYSDGGTVTLSNLTSNTNGEDGVFVDNTLKWNPVTLVFDIPAGAAVTLNGAGVFNGNAVTGLVVQSSGAITTNGVAASDNGFGAYLDNCFASGPNCTTILGKTVTMNGNNTFNNNFSGDGLSVESWGAIKVNNLTANGNLGRGATLDNNWTSATGTVTITGFSTTSSNRDGGLFIYSNGSVTTSNLTANFNGPTSAASGDVFYRGVTIRNDTDPTKNMGVTLLGINQFNNNWNTGLEITSYGIVTLNNVTATNNGAPYDLANNPTPEGNGVLVDNSGALVAKGVTINGVNTFNGNLDDGLNILSKGAILANNVTANGNTGSGAVLDNKYDLFTTPITILGYGTFSDNQDGGLVILSNGNVITNNLIANNTAGGTGVYIENYYNATSSSFVSVTMNGLNTFNGNIGNGLTVYSDGTITLNNITANNNSGYGANLDNSSIAGGVLKNITLNGYNTFVSNTSSGIKFNSSGTVNMTRITADMNTLAGVEGTAVGSINLTCGSLLLNTGAGYNLSASALITLKGIFTFGNGAVNAASGTPVITRTCPLP